MVWADIYSKRNMKTFFTNLYWNFYTWSTASTVRAWLVSVALMGTLFTIDLTPWLISLKVDAFWYGWIISVVMVGVEILGFIGTAIYNSIKS